jgi:hypothetical protein
MRSMKYLECAFRVLAAAGVPLPDALCEFFK